MKEVNDLEDLLIHHIQNLYAAEEQMLEALPPVIEKAQHSSLKRALEHHLKLTLEQKKRLEAVLLLINERKSSEKNKLALLPDTQYQCKGMIGLIAEAKELMEGKLAKEVTDAAIIACVQKMEHYEITTYGTAHAYAEQLDLPKAAALLSETLNEEYDIDDLLTALATSSFNKEAEPEGIASIEDQVPETDKIMGGSSKNTGTTHISERTINSPGGRAGTSHRRYPSGESRGH